MKSRVINFKQFEKLNEQIIISTSILGLEKLSRLSDNMTNILNEQIVAELESSQIYRAMACWLNKEGWPDATNYYMTTSDEELQHMRDLYTYMFLKNADVEVSNEFNVTTEFSDIRELVTRSLKHEMTITERWNNIANAAIAEKDNDTYQLSQKFLTEQLDEEEKFRTILEKINLDMPKYEIDRLFITIS